MSTTMISAKTANMIKTGYFISKIPRAVCNSNRLVVRHKHEDKASTYTPRRAVMYVPGNDERKMLKIPNLGADCIVMDCEDGVAINRKEEARNTISKMLDQLDFGRSEPVLRVNSVGSGLAEEDLNVGLQAKRLPPTLMLPKVEQVSEMDWFAEKVSAAVSGRSDVPNFKLVIFVETAIGLLNLKDICQRGSELGKDGPYTLDGVVFGSDDFLADIGGMRTEDAKELLYARQKVVLIAKAFRLQAIDLVHINYKDLDSLRVQSLEGARMGFTGKQAIHPTQVPIIHECFSPSLEQQEWARALTKAFEQHQSTGKGAFTFRGRMIDMPLLLQAKNIIQIANNINRFKS